MPKTPFRGDKKMEQNGESESSRVDSLLTENRETPKTGGFLPLGLIERSSRKRNPPKTGPIWVCLLLRVLVLVVILKEHQKENHSFGGVP